MCELFNRNRRWSAVSISRKLFTKLENASLILGSSASGKEKGTYRVSIQYHFYSTHLSGKWKILIKCNGAPARQIFKLLRGCVR